MCAVPLIGAAILAALLVLPAAPVFAQDKWPERLVGHGGPVKAVEVSSDGREALTASFDYTVILWGMDGEEGVVEARLIGHKAAVNDVAFVTNTHLAVSVGDDGAFAIWDLAKKKLITRIEDTGDKVLDVAVNHDGRYAAAARWDGTVRVYDIAAAKETARGEGHKGNVNAVSFSLDGRELFSASYDGEVRGWPLDGGHIIGQPRVLYSNGWGVNVLAALPGGSMLAFGTLDGTTGVIDLRSLEVTKLAEGEHPVLSIDVSERAGTFAAGTSDGHIRVFDVDTGILVEDYHDNYGPIWGLSFVPDGDRLYRTGLDDYAIGWQVDPREPFEPGHSVYPRRFEARDIKDPGELEFLRKCSVCHTLAPDGAHRAGPTLYGLFGRVAGTVGDYVYSDALKESGIVWTAETVGRLFDDGPDVVTPGTKMPVQRLKSVSRRDELIRYLQEATRPNGTVPAPGRMK